MRNLETFAAHAALYAQTIETEVAHVNAEMEEAGLVPVFGKMLSARSIEEAMAAYFIAAAEEGVA